MEFTQYTKGLHEVAGGAYAWLQPPGSWSLSNAGLVTDGEDSLVIDTQTDLALTREMLTAMRGAAPRATRSIGTLVNTHHNSDHTFGNELVGASEIIASAAAVEPMTHEGPALMKGFVEAAPRLGDLGAYVLHCFGRFDYSGITQTLPTRTFRGRLDLKVGDKDVHLLEVGPAHSPGDVLVHVPRDRTIFAGDILFIDGTPIMWAGPVGNWIAACDLILGLDVDAIVPGHGPITDKAGVAKMRGYLVYIRDEARKRFDAGLDALTAARDIALGDYDAWGEAERIAVNTATLYREFGARDVPADALTLFGWMAQIWKDRRA